MFCIAHCDIKPANIILIESEKKSKYSYKISDFGESIEIAGSSSNNLRHKSELKSCTKAYAAPEILKIFKDDANSPEFYDPFKADVYSLGLVVLEMMGCKKPRKLLNKGLSNEILENMPLKTFQNESFENLKKLFNLLLNEDSASRISFKDIVLLCSDFKTRKPDKLLDDMAVKKAMKAKENDMAKTNNDIFDCFRLKIHLFQVYAIDIGDLEEAKFFLDQAFEILNENFAVLQNIKAENKYFSCLCLFFEETGDYDKALEISLKIEELEENNNENFHRKNLEKLKEIEEIFKKWLENDNEGEIYTKISELVALNKLRESKIDEEHNLDPILTPILKQELYNLKMIRKDWGVYSKITAQKMGEIGQIFHALKEFQRAEFYFLKTLRIMQFCFGKFSEEVSDILYELGSTYIDERKDIKKAKYYALRSLIMREKLFGNKHLKVSYSFNNVAHIYSWSGNKKKAEEMYIKEYMILRELAPNNMDQVTRNLTFIRIERFFICCCPCFNG